MPFISWASITRWRPPCHGFSGTSSGSWPGCVGVRGSLPWVDLAAGFGIAAGGIRRLGRRRRGLPSLRFGRGWLDLGAVSLGAGGAFKGGVLCAGTGNGGDPRLDPGTDSRLLFSLIYWGCRFTRLISGKTGGLPRSVQTKGCEEACYLF